MSVRDTILDNLRTQLRTILTTAGYHTDVKAVTLGANSFDAIAEDCPYAAVVQGNEVIEVEDDTNIRFRMKVGLTLFVKGQTTIGMSDDINNFADDVKTLIYSPIDLGTHCLDCQLKDMEISISLSENMAAAGMILEIVYWAAKTAF